MGRAHNVPHAVSMNSASSGLDAAIGAFGIGYGDEVTWPCIRSACAVCARPRCDSDFRDVCCLREL